MTDEPVAAGTALVQHKAMATLMRRVHDDVVHGRIPMPEDGQAVGTPCKLCGADAHYRRSGSAPAGYYIEHPVHQLELHRGHEQADLDLEPPQRSADNQED